MEQEKTKFVSVIMPLYNEEQYIKNCIKSMLRQDYPKESMEWLFVDGGSKDRTKEWVQFYQDKHPNLIRLLDNPHKTVPFAMNIGIQQAAGEYIVRLDAHANYATDYISRCIFYLDTLGIDNVGGLAQTRGRGKIGNTIAKMLSSKFGVGNSQFRTGGKAGFVDTVPFGAFRRDVFEKYGGYDERLDRNQDNEMNYRIRKNGGKIYLADDIHFSYYCRDSIKGLCEMAEKNGMWNIVTMRLCPGSMGSRHFVPLAFVLSILLFPLFGLFCKPLFRLFGAEMAIYFLLDACYSAKQAGDGKELVLLMFLFPAFHIAYGAGSVHGILKLFEKEFR